MNAIRKNLLEEERWKHPRESTALVHHDFVIVALDDWDDSTYCNNVLEVMMFSKGHIGQVIRSRESGPDIVMSESPTSSEYMR